MRFAFFFFTNYQVSTEPKLTQKKENLHWHFDWVGDFWRAACGQPVAAQTKSPFSTRSRWRCWLPMPTVSSSTVSSPGPPIPASVRSVTQNQSVRKQARRRKFQIK